MAGMCAAFLPKRSTVEIGSTFREALRVGFIAHATDLTDESLRDKSKLPGYSCRLWFTEHVFPMLYAFAATGMSL